MSTTPLPKQFEAGKLTSLPYFGTLSTHESFRLTTGIGMVAGGFLLGAVGGVLVHASEEYQHKQMFGHIKQHAEIQVSKSRLLRLMGTNALKYGGFVSMFVGTELILGRIRKKEDDWNICVAGAITGGTFTARGGPAAGIAGTVMGCSLAYITSAGLNILQDIEKIVIERDLRRDEENLMQEIIEEEEELLDTTEVQIERLKGVLKDWPEQPRKG
tara:strand:+ start:233 stop:877 length:645 start_codon:yes stop_codon:yes gene_type:complete